MILDAYQSRKARQRVMGCLELQLEAAQEVKNFLTTGIVSLQCKSLDLAEESIHFAGVNVL